MKTKKKQKHPGVNIESYRLKPITLTDRVIETYILQNISTLKRMAYRKTIKATEFIKEALVNLTGMGISNQSLEWERHSQGDAERINRSHIYLRKDVYIRKTVAQKLLAVNKQLQTTGYHLHVRSGYRHPKIQEMRYLISVEKFGEEYARSRFALKEDLIGTDANYPHTTGGVFDVEIWKGDQRIAMGEKGVPIGTFDLELLMSKANKHKLAKQKLIQSKLPSGFSEAPTHWTEYRNNRRLLYHVMRGAGFYFILDEFWHWGIGDHLSCVAAYLLGKENYRPWYGRAKHPTC